MYGSPRSCVCEKGLSWQQTFFWPVRRVSRHANLPIELCPLPSVATYECVSLAPRAPNSHLLRIARPWFRQGLSCLDELVARPCADPRVLHTPSHVLLPSTHLHVLRVACWTDQHDSLSPPRAARGGRSPCHQSSVGIRVLGMVVDSAVPRMVHSCASPGTPRRWSLCPQGLHRKR